MDNVCVTSVTKEKLALKNTVMTTVQVTVTALTTNVSAIKAGLELLVKRHPVLTTVLITECVSKESATAGKDSQASLVN